MGRRDLRERKKKEHERRQRRVRKRAVQAMEVTIDIGSSSDSFSHTIRAHSKESLQYKAYRDGYKRIVKFRKRRESIQDPDHPQSLGKTTWYYGTPVKP